MEHPGPLAPAGRPSAAGAEMEREDAPFGPGDPHLSGGRLHAAPLAATGPVGRAAREGQKVFRGEQMVLVPARAGRTKPDPTVGSFSEVGDAGDLFLRAEVTIPHHRLV